MNLPSPTHTDSREHVHPHDTEAINSHGPLHRDKASEQAIKQTKLDDDSGGMLRSDARSSPYLSFAGPFLSTELMF